MAARTGDFIDSGPCCGLPLRVLRQGTLCHQQYFVSAWPHLGQRVQHATQHGLQWCGDSQLCLVHLLPEASHRPACTTSTRFLSLSCRLRIAVCHIEWPLTGPSLYQLLIKEDARLCTHGQLTLGGEGGDPAVPVQHSKMVAPALKTSAAAVGSRSLSSSGAR